MSAYECCQSPAEFEAGYANSITPEVVTHWEAIFRRDSEHALARLSCRQNLAYGPHERHRLDFFPAAGSAPTAPTLVAIHGGLWFLFDKWMMHFLAEMFTGAGFHVAAISYPLAPQRALGEIVEDCRAAVRWLHGQAGVLGIDRGRMSVLGHSAAGQLCTMVASTRWEEPGGFIHRCVGVSGFYDIEPFFQTSFAQMTRFAQDDYRRWNPMNHVDAHLPPCLLITGGQESALLHEMTSRFAGKLRDAGARAQTFDAPGECHFSVLRGLGDAGSAVFREARAFLEN